MLSKRRLGPASTWDTSEGKHFFSDYRQSETMFFNVGENPLVRLIEDRIARTTNIPIENGEGLQVVHYNVGEYYKPHWDYFDPAFAGNSIQYDRGGQRIATVIMYLNFVEAGGETWFPNVGLSIQPEEGKALVWFNVDVFDGQLEIDASTFHEAKPVVKGEKWIMTKWLRESTFR